MGADDRQTSVMLQLGFASVFALAALACVAVSFSTDYWVVTTVDRSDARDDGLSADQLLQPYSFTRNRGLFRTCYDGNETLFIDNLDDDDVDGKCVEEKGYELDRRSRTNDWGNDYDRRIHLMRTHFGFFIVSMLFYVIGIILAIVGCWSVRISVLQFAGLMVFVGAFFAAGGMAMFHGYDYLEREKLDISGEDFPAYWAEDSSLEALDDNTKREYGYSYMLGWISVGLGAISAILFLCASFSIRPARPYHREEKELPPHGYGNEAFDNYYPTYPAPGYGPGAAPSYYGYGY